MRKRIAILGSTGSIGTQALDVIAAHPDRFEVVALAAGRQVEKLREQAAAFNVPIVAHAGEGADGLHRVAVDSKPDLVLAATDGFVSFDAVFAAVERGTDVAVANKELIVAAGELLLAQAKRSGSSILPVDSEHSAIFQCLVGEDPARVAFIVLTASGGPFLRTPREALERVTVEAALAHPTWRMGTKNSVDSASMMNKGLEIIEASRLFGLPGERVRVLVHPQSIAHGMVVFTDGSMKMQAAAPDMRLPIGYALAHPDRLAPRHSDAIECHADPSTSRLRRSAQDYASRTPDCHADPSTSRLRRSAQDYASRGPDCHAELVEARLSERSESKHDPLLAIGAKLGQDALRYDFELPDFDRFPCLQLAYEALAAGGTMPAVLSAANEVAVAAFVNGQLPFIGIAAVIESAMRAASGEPLTLEAVRRADKKARADATAALAAVV